MKVYELENFLSEVPDSVEIKFCLVDGAPLKVVDLEISGKAINYTITIKLETQ
jgi:hypothetical protein